MDKALFKRDPRSFALDLVDAGMISSMDLLTAALNWMSRDDVREMLDANELSPRFDSEEIKTSDTINNPRPYAGY